MYRTLCKYSIIILALAAGASCSKVPRGILNENKMKDVMIDMQLAEQIINDNYREYSDSAHKAALFDAVFRKHSTTQAVYDSSLVWYGKNLDIMIQVLDLALNDMNRRIAALGDVQAAPNKESGDSTDIWPRQKRMTFYPEALFNGTVFDIKPETPYISGSSFVLNMRVWGLNPETKRLPQIMIAAQMQDTTVTVNRTIENDGYHSITLQTIATKPVNRVYGYIRMDNVGEDCYRVYVDSLSLMKYNYGSLMTQ